MSAKLYLVFLANVRERMEALNMSQAELANRMKVTPSYVSQLLSGHRRPGLDGLEDMAKALEVEPSDLIAKRILSKSA